MSLKPSVSTDGGATFNENALAFATREEAETSASRSARFSGSGLIERLEHARTL